MGPNLYITPPGSITHFHQDGHGSVDSGHQCIQGYNEVVMLRRLPEDDKKHAMNILCGNLDYDALLGLPHRNVCVNVFVHIIMLFHVSYSMINFNLMLRIGRGKTSLARCRCN